MADAIGPRNLSHELGGYHHEHEEDTERSPAIHIQYDTTFILQTRQTLGYYPEIFRDEGSVFHVPGSMASEIDGEGGLGLVRSEVPNDEEDLKVTGPKSKMDSDEEIHAGVK